MSWPKVSFVSEVQARSLVAIAVDLQVVLCHQIGNEIRLRPQKRHDVVDVEPHTCVPQPYKGPPLLLGQRLRLGLSTILHIPQNALCQVGVDATVFEKAAQIGDVAIVRRAERLQGCHRCGDAA